MNEYKIGQKVWYRQEFSYAWRRAKVIMIEPLLVRDFWSRLVTSPQLNRIVPR